MSVQNKHFMNSASTLVDDALKGLCVLNPQLGLDVQNKTVYIKKQDRSKVALMCGGGAGHEPAHAAYVGKGILTCAVSGSIFASPNASQVRKGIELIDNDKGTVIIVKNYTGDILNFGLAKEQYAANHPEKAERLKFVIVADDVSVGREQGKIVGRRGLAGTTLVYKIAGALAERGASLDEVYNMATWISSRLATIGVSLGHTHVPGTASSTSNELSSSEVEIGMGIHNENGHKRVSPIPKLSDLVHQLLDFLTSTTDPDRSFVPFQEKGNKVVLLVNNLGGTSELELSGIVTEVKKQLDARGFTTCRVLAGTFMTSLNMSGVSLTLLLLPSDGEKDAPEASQILSLLDDRSETLGWKWTAQSAPVDISQQTSPVAIAPVKSAQLDTVQVPNPTHVLEKIQAAAKACIAAEPEITRMDTIAGDGDAGLTLKAGAEAVLGKIKTGDISAENISQSVITIAQVAEEAMGGTSGALYSIFFSGLAQGLQTHATPNEVITPEVWSRVLKSTLDKLYSYTRARPPSRTLVDPLDAFIGTFGQSLNSTDAVKAAAKAAEATKNLAAKAGRSAYVEGDRLKREQVPDPGAWAVKVILEHLFA
ncbi:dihydroxyacetone kinase [Panaeolus papilionaceus]|nr:dihydroxyacetone kinase [Panaeolus papilionaceus]